MITVCALRHFPYHRLMVPKNLFIRQIYIIITDSIIP